MAQNGNMQERINQAKVIDKSIKAIQVRLEDPNLKLLHGNRHLAATDGDVTQLRQLEEAKRRVLFS